MTQQWSVLSQGETWQTADRKSRSWTQEIIADFKRNRTETSPAHINGERVEVAHTFRFQVVLIFEDLSWTDNISAVFEKASSVFTPLRILLKNKMQSIESPLAYCISIWSGSCTEPDRVGLQRTVKAVQRMVDCAHLSLADIYSSRCLSRVRNIIEDTTHRRSRLFELLPSGRRYRCSKKRIQQTEKQVLFTTLNSLMTFSLHMHCN